MLARAVAKRSCRAERASFYTTRITGLTGMQPLALSKSTFKSGHVRLAMEFPRPLSWARINPSWSAERA